MAGITQPCPDCGKDMYFCECDTDTMELRKQITTLTEELVEASTRINELEVTQTATALKYATALKELAEAKGAIRQCLNSDYTTWFDFGLNCERILKNFLSGQETKHTTK